jgi:hypothetical protein
VVSKPGEEYSNSGGSTDAGGYGFPIENTKDANNLYSNIGQRLCKQTFNGRSNNFPVIDYCNDIQKKTTIFRYGQSQSVQLTMRNNSQYRYKYGDNRKVWIVAHGLANTGDDIINISDAIMSQDPSAIVMTLTWSGAKRFAQPLPNQVDEWIRPSAQAVAKTLKEWGMTNASNLNMAGHSMGTMVINEIARAMNLEQSAGNTNQLIYLDPPSYTPGFTQFDVDDDEQTQDSIYSATNGYQRTGVTAITMRAFSGLTSDGGINICGNSQLNLTAKEHISMMMGELPLEASPLSCNIHGEVHKAWSKMIQQNPAILDTLKISTTTNPSQGGSIAPYQDTTFNISDTNFDASIYISGNNQDSAKPENITYSEAGIIKQNGRDGMNNQFSNASNNANLTTTPQTIYLQNFETQDKVSLHRDKQNSLGQPISRSNYDVVGNTITRTVCVTDTNGACTNVYVGNHVSLSGVGGVTQQSYLDAQFGSTSDKEKSAIQLRNN